jgi:uncharacterized protein
MSDEITPRRRLLTRRRLFGTVAGLGIAGFGWMRFVEPKWYSLAKHTVPLGLPRPVKVLHLSDFHAAPAPLPHIADSVARGLAEKPDIVCLTGDFITWKYERWDDYAEVLAPLAKAAPTFAVLGNHDGGKWSRRFGYGDTTLVRDLLAKTKVQLLHNTHTTVEVGGQQLRLVGLGDWWADEMEPREAFNGTSTEPQMPTVLLSHNPDTKDRLVNFAWDLMLSGHTHGGQLALPLIGTPFAPVRDKRFVRGLHQWQNRWLHVTAGVGALHSMRFNCRPEISVLTLT